MELLNVGLDVGSTTAKLVVLADGRITHKKYLRHLSGLKEAVIALLEECRPLLADRLLTMTVTGSGGLPFAQTLNVPFVQEVIACTEAVKQYIPETDVAIELGGEDAKITYFDQSLEQRMNGTCAGGTGAFIDQMAALLQTDAAGLNELARHYKTLYPIASRCGVFAKTDIQPLLNEGAAPEDIAASVFQAVVNQTIGGLAQGRPIKGKVAFLGGPLHFLPELRQRFRQTLVLEPEQYLHPEDSQFFVALGAALSSVKESPLSGPALYERAVLLPHMERQGDAPLTPLFTGAEDYARFRARHARHTVPKRDLTLHQGKTFLGIDAGSTTTKVALIDDEGRLLYSYYGNNKGKPLETTVEALQELYAKLPPKAWIANSVVTGYGEPYIQAALKVDLGEIETVAHYKAANFFLPGVDFVLDIGGQDMKCLVIKEGVIDSILLNEACSSGCGSFIETFATSLQLEVNDFAGKGIRAQRPVDLGTRCTVFMNSKVRQVQKEGAEVEDISAGLALSVIKNALFKIIRFRSADDLGQKIVAQGGTFYNDAVLRALEMITGREVVRPDISGIMGAFGAALIAREHDQEGHSSTLLPADALEHLHNETEFRRCEFCGNHCRLTVHHFNDGRSFISGNRCERGLGLQKENNPLPNLYAYKYRRVFNYRPLKEEDARRGSIGLPRALNMYDDYPFWFTLFTELGYRVILSGRSSQTLYALGMESISSDSVCYPAKLVHGHIADLVQKGLKTIFYPSIPFNIAEDPQAGNHYNCPIVTSYPETIGANMEILGEQGVKFYHPFLPLDSPHHMAKRLAAALAPEGLPLAEIRPAVQKAYAELSRYREDVRKQGKEALRFMREHHRRGIVLAGRPYHIDPELHHGIPDMLQSYGFAVLSEDSVRDLAVVERPLQMIDQWVYDSRLYAAATLVAQEPDLELIQLNSFGCGLDSITSEQVREILRRYGKIYTTIKIDDINNLGGARIRVRSLIASIYERDKKGFIPRRKYQSPGRVLFTTAMKEQHTILAPQMSPVHFQFLKTAFTNAGYRIELLPDADQAAVDEGLRFVNNDACYPAILVVGQVMKALRSGSYDPEQTSVIVSQTGGGCRATNYIAYLRKALRDAGLGHIPVISLNTAGLEPNPGFQLTRSLFDEIMQALVYGDLLMRVLHRVRPYEQVPGSADTLYDYWVEECQNSLQKRDRKAFNRNVEGIVRQFDRLPLDETKAKPRVGIVGEIMVKYYPAANNNLVQMLEEEGAEVIVPDLIDFLLYNAMDSQYQYQFLAGPLSGVLSSRLAVGIIEWYRRAMKKALRHSRRFQPPLAIGEFAQAAQKHLSLANQTGEGWFLTGEMEELLHSGTNNILCIQPFACLPNHVIGRGMLRELKKHYPGANISFIDYDSGASAVNQFNRIKLMLTVAKEAVESG
ncbi:FldB/FldC dehydratase alpha/beta subunit [Acididesulfobacillus acetoxydans]|uniref:CoA-substrate-specific enzyme activase domain protein n=2 Tax=Acididesulfobacillus acetoxydans TaxID=1561005 RepID=A0A8S0W230_9FIRM|nr:FldB/FldC dehydratase alpha/beta subunit [Acididesulfobacillus acetoxydans]CEJ06074.1 CoA-substrate-specific enzyme activase domain protein [Acididesulfobacillus acetoxydans]